MNAPAGDWAQILLSDHLAKISGITYFLEYGAAILLVAASRRCRETHQVPSCVRVKEAEVFKDSAIPHKLKLAGRHANSGPIYRDILKEQVGGDIEAVGQSPYVLDCQLAFTMKDFGNDAGGTKYIR